MKNNCNICKHYGSDWEDPIYGGDWCNIKSNYFEGRFSFPLKYTDCENFILDEKRKWSIEWWAKQSHDNKW